MDSFVNNLEKIVCSIKALNEKNSFDLSLIFAP